MRFLVSLSFTASLLVGPSPAAGAREAARPRPGVVRNAWDEDIAAKQVLDREGAFLVARDVVLWFPMDSLTGEQAARIVARLDHGIRAAKLRIGKPDWQVAGDRRVHFYCPATHFISHAPGGNCAFIPLWRMREDQSPWLHESLHLLLATGKGDWLALEDSVAMRRMPLWLSEGLADALAMQVSEEAGVAYFSPLLGDRPERLDSLAAAALRGAPSDSVLAMIGARGKLPQLFGPDRARYAVPFYAGSASFARFIARGHGFRPLLRAIADFDHENETLARELGQPLERVKSDWLASIGLGARGRTGTGLPQQGSVKDLGPAGSFSGMLAFTPPADGICRVSAGSALGIDAVVGARSVASGRFEMQPGCRTIFKSIAFAFRAGEPVVLQVGGSTLATAGLPVTRWSD